MLCNDATAAECFERELFGSRQNMAQLLAPLQRGDEGFLYHYVKDILFGPFRAVSGIAHHEPEAWHPQRFPVQFRVEWDDEGAKELRDALAIFRTLGVRLSRFGNEAQYEVPSQPILYGDQARGLANHFARKTGGMFRTIDTVETSRLPQEELSQPEANDFPQSETDGVVVRICVGEVDRYISSQIAAGVIGSFSPRASRHVVPRPSDDEIQVTSEFEALLSLVEKREPLIFLTGKAGTGKSTLIRLVRERFAGRNLAVVAPSGIAALNAGGQTIHSFFGIAPHEVDDIHPVADPTVIRELDLLVIDEVSMVRADLLDAVDRSLKVNRSSSDSFGGVPMLLVGDLFQLSPIVQQPEAPLFEGERYRSPFFFSAKAFESQEMACLELTHVFRQEDRHFVDLLEQVREAISPDCSLPELNRRVEQDLRQAGEDPLVLCCLNGTADGINSGRLAGLPGPSQTYLARIEGDFPEEKFPCPQHLALKRGARVLFCRNDPLGRWVNGTRGVVEALGLNGVSVRTREGELFQVDRVTWENHVYEYNDLARRVVTRPAGKFHQIPLRLAWAISIHRSQGLTLDEVAIDLGDGAFAEGQVYVALSRCRSLEGIRLLNPIRSNDIRTDRRVSWFYRAMRGEFDDSIEAEVEPVSAVDQGDGLVIRLPASVREKLKARAEREGCTIEAMIEELVEEQFRPRW